MRRLLSYVTNRAGTAKTLGHWLRHCGRNGRSRESTRKTNGTRMLWKACCVTIAALALLLLMQPAQAATLNVSPDGQLRGASGINVNGTLYDVQFVDGSCIDLFGGCDNAADDFTFPNFPDASEAASQLLNQVFLNGPQGDFDTQPELTSGCEDGGLCQIGIPFTIGQVKLANNGPGITDSTGNAFVAPHDDFTTRPVRVYAVFAPAAVIPLPATLPLFGTGLGLMGLLGWWRRRRVAAEAV